MLRELATGAQRDFHCPNVSRIDHTRKRDRPCLRSVSLALRANAPVSISSQWQRVGQSYRLDARDRLDASGRADHTARSRCSVSLILTAGFDAPGSGLFRAKAGIHFQQPQKASNQQSRAHQQNACERDFRHHQRAANPALRGRLRLNRGLLLSNSRARPSAKPEARARFQKAVRSATRQQE